MRTPPVSISIVTATYNRCSFLPTCIKSVGSQKYALKEHIVIDGASSDGTINLLREYAELNSHFRFISEKDDGLSAALNKGLAMATGDVIGVIGDDDYYEPDAFEIVARAFEKHPEAGMIVGGCRFFRNDGTTEKIAPARYTDRSDLIACWWHWGKRVWLPHASAFVRKEVIADVGGFDVNERYAMDYHHYLKITQKYPVVIIEDILSNFQSDAGTLSFSQHEKSWNETLTISRKYWGAPGSAEYRAFARSFLLYSVLRGGKNILKQCVKPLMIWRKRHHKEQ